MESCFKSIFYSCALLVYTVSFSRGQRYLSEFSSASPAMCGKTKIVNGDNAFFFNEVLSSEARSKAAFHERSKGLKYFDNPPGNPTFPSGDKSLGRPNPLKSNNPKFPSDSFKNKQYRKQISKMARRLPTQFNHPTREPTPKPLDFSNFMLKRFTQPFKNEKRRFPEEITRIVTTRKPKIKRDMLSGLSKKAKVEGKKKNKSSHSNHRDKPSKLPPMIQHILEKKKQKQVDAVELNLAPSDGNISPYHPPGPMTDNSVVGPPSAQSRPMPMGPMGNNGPSSQMGPSGGGGGWMDVLGSLGPDKIQKLKQLLGRMENEPEKTDSGLPIPVRRVPYEPENRRMESGGAPRGEVYELHPDRPRTKDDHRRRRPQAYNLNRYSEKRDNGADLRSKHHFGGDMGRKDPDLYPEVDYPVVPNADAGEMDESSLNRRVKREVSQDERSSSEMTDVKSCTWVFRKGSDCKRMVIKMQYWVDGVRDCSKEYLQIRGSRNINSPSDKLCGGQESLTPYVVEGDEVSIKHFRDMLNIPGLTKFKGMIQCEQ